MPEIVGSLVTDGVVITLPEPTAYDAWAQFFKNATQMGLFVMVILFSGVLSSELSKGTLINLLTKGLSRTAVILSKYTCMVSVWTISISLCFGLTYGYTAYLSHKVKHQICCFLCFGLWLFGLFFTGGVIIFSHINKKQLWRLAHNRCCCGCLYGYEHHTRCA